MQLVSEYNYYKSKGTLTEDGYFYSTVEHLENETCLSGHEQRKAIKVLEELNTLTITSKGIPAKRHFKINFEGIAVLFDNIEKEKTSRNPRNSQLSKILTTSDKKIEQQDGKNFNINNKIYNNINKGEIDRLKDYIINARTTKLGKKELEKEFQRLKIELTDEYIKILSHKAYRRLLLMRAGVTSVFCSPHRYKLHYLCAEKLITIFDKYMEYEEKTDIDEPVRYFKKILIEYLDEQVTI